MSQLSKRTVRSYDKEFKRNAVKLYFSSGKSYGKLADDLGIPMATLVGWVNNGKHHAEHIADTSSERQDELTELKRLRKELMEVKEERDILKKAVAIFSEKPKK